MKLGAGLALLIWCYDGVERDGTVKIELGKATTALGMSYRTVKDWWKLISEGPFFSSVKDRGKLGYVATFNRDWIEWRVMATNYPTVQDGEGQNTALEETNIPAQGPVKAPSRPDDGQIAALDGRMYKVLHTNKDHVLPIAEIAPDLAVASVDAPAAQPEKKKRKPQADKPEEPPTPIEIRQALAAVCDVDISPGAKPPQKQIALLNCEAKTIWQQMQSQGKTVKAAITGIRESARYTRATDKRFTNPASRLPIPIIRENWTAMARWLKDQVQPYQNGTSNGVHIPDPELLSDAEALAGLRAIRSGGFGR
jgi:hypothetical protein